MINKYDIIQANTIKVSGDKKFGAGFTDITSDLSGGLSSIALSKASGAANVVNVTINPKDAEGNILTGVRNLRVWLSDASTGLGAGSSFSVDSISASTGSVLKALTAAADLIAQTDANGVLVLAITDTGNDEGYICVENPADGKIFTLQIEAADYGA